MRPMLIWRPTSTTQIAKAVRPRVFDPRDQAEGERDRHRIVASRLSFERPGQTARYVSEPKCREDGGGIRRRDDGTEQERLEPGEIEQRVGHDTGDQGAHDDPDGAEKRCRNRYGPQPPPGCLKPALIEDQAKAYGAGLSREVRVIELDPSGPVGPEQHPQPQERDENREARSRRPQRQSRAQAEDRTDDQKR